MSSPTRTVTINERLLNKEWEDIRSRYASHDTTRSTYEDERSAKITLCIARTSLMHGHREAAEDAMVGSWMLSRLSGNKTQSTFCTMSENDMREAIRYPTNGRFPSPEFYELVKEYAKGMPNDLASVPMKSVAASASSLSTVSSDLSLVEFIANLDDKGRSFVRTMLDAYDDEKKKSG